MGAVQVTEQGFRHFLVDSPLECVRAEDCATGECSPCGFGSFHQQYWLDGALSGFAWP